MSKPHPSMALTLDLDESIVDHELRLEIDRCYSYLGTPVVRTHPAADGEPVNTLRMTVRVGAREYLDSSVEGADALWSDYIEHWLLNQVHAVDNQMKIFNRRQREEGKPELAFTWLEIELAGRPARRAHAAGFHLRHQSRGKQVGEPRARGPERRRRSARTSSP